MKFSLNQKGQEFSVFKLLISAIVAVTILAIVLAIIGSIPGIGNTDPTKASVEAVRSQLTQLGTPKKVPKVNFGDGVVLSSVTIARGTGEISSNQVCVTTGGSVSDDSRFVNDPEGVIVKYVSSAAQTTGLLVFCDTAREFNDDADITGVTGKAYLDACEGDLFTSPGDETQRICVVAIVPE
ncbi:MAG: hypothetical protein V1494_00075 [Candidatus Diapherotrites archaeon]